MEIFKFLSVKRLLRHPVYGQMKQYRKELSFLLEAVQILGKSLSSYLSELATAHNNVGLMHENMCEYSDAISSYKKSIEIREKTAPPNPYLLAISYHDYGIVLAKMGKRANALSLMKKALPLMEKVVSTIEEVLEMPLTTHLKPRRDLMLLCTHIGNMHFKLGQYSGAASHYEQALKIEEKTPSSYDTNLLIVVYNDIGLFYAHEGDYSKAALLLEKKPRRKKRYQPKITHI